MTDQELRPTDVLKRVPGLQREPLLRWTKQGYLLARLETVEGRPTYLYPESELPKLQAVVRLVADGYAPRKAFEKVLGTKVDRLKLRQEADAAEKAGRFDKVIDALKQIIQENPRDWNAVIHIGDLYAKLNNTKAANEQYVKAARYFTDDGFYLKAIAVWRKVLRNEPAMLEGHVSLGELYQKQGLVAEARQTFAYAYDEYVKRNKLRDAGEVLRRMADVDPSDVKVRIRLAELYAREGDPEKAGSEYMTPEGTSTAGTDLGDASLADIFRDFQNGVERQLGKEDYETRYNLGIAYKEMGLVDEAIGEFQLAAKDESRMLECASMLGICFLEKGMPKLAVKWFEKGLQAPGRSEDEYQALRYDLASALEQAGETERALALFTELYGQDASFRDVTTRMRRLISA